MRIEIHITNTECKIITPLDSSMLATLRMVCSFEPEGHEYMARNFHAKGKKWDGSRKLFNIQTRRFPVGLLSLVTNTLQTMGNEVAYVNKRTFSDAVCDFHMDNFDVRDYQTRVVFASVTNGNGIIKAATGSGKTTMAARTIGAINKPTIFIVHTRDLLYQTIEAFTRMFPGEEIGQIGDGKFEYRDITVATMQSLAILGDVKYESYKYDEDSQTIKESKSYYQKEELKKEFQEYRKRVGVVVFDEVQLICSQTAYSVRFLFDNANYAFGYSASPWRDDGSDLMIEAAFGSRICDVTASELIDLGYLVQPHIEIHRVQDRMWHGKKYAEIYESAIVQNPMRNLQVANDAYQQYQMGRNTLVLINHIAHGEIIEDILRNLGAPAVFISGKSRMKHRRQVIQDMRDGKAPIVVASTIADVGLDVPRLQTVVEAGAGKSSVTALQRLGRVMRPFEGKDTCHFITYRDNAPFLRDQVDNKIRIWSTEPNFIIEER